METKELEFIAFCMKQHSCNGCKKELECFPPRQKGVDKVEIQQVPKQKNNYKWNNI